jgi:hypothetical protein
MADEITEFVSSLSSYVQTEVARLTEDLTFTKLVHAARSSVEALAEESRENLEDKVADELGIE